MFHYGWGAGSWLVMGFMMALICALLIAAIVWVVRGSAHPANHAQPPAQRNAPQILDERLARGEIGEDEYRQRRELLG